MTELATPPVAEQTDVKRISHWIGGRSVAGAVGPQRPGLQPGDRQADAARSTSPPSTRSTPRCRPRRQAFVEWRHVSLAKRAELFFNIRELVHERREEVAKILTRGARQGAVGRDRGGHARARGDRVLLRPPDAAEERVLGAGVDRDRRLLDPPAARRRRRHHAVQLPGDGAHVDVGAGDRDAATRSCSSRRRRIRRRRSGRRSC